MIDKPTNNDPVESVDAIELLGASVMCGHHESGETELVISSTDAALPMSAGDAFYRGNLRRI